jgi:hypothetical protein
MLSQMDAHVMGIVVNGVDPGRHSNYYYTYGYGNYYGGKSNESVKLPPSGRSGSDRGGSGSGTRADAANAQPAERSERPTRRRSSA